MRLLLLPFGRRRRGPSDRVTQACAEILLAPSATRDRLTAGIAHGVGDDGLARLERAFELTVAAQPLQQCLHQAHVRDVEEARERHLINDVEATQLRAAAEAVAAAVAVDDFSPQELTGRRASIA